MLKTTAATPATIKRARNIAMSMLASVDYMMIERIQVYCCFTTDRKAKENICFAYLQKYLNMVTAVMDARYAHLCLENYHKTLISSSFPLWPVGLRPDSASEGLLHLPSL